MKGHRVLSFKPLQHFGDASHAPFQRTLRIDLFPSRAVDEQGPSGGIHAEFSLLWVCTRVRPRRSTSFPVADLPAAISLLISHLTWPLLPIVSRPPSTSASVRCGRSVDPRSIWYLANGLSYQRTGHNRCRCSPLVEYNLRRTGDPLVGFSPVVSLHLRGVAPAQRVAVLVQPLR